jgi:hypothetical protein
MLTNAHCFPCYLIYSTVSTFPIKTFYPPRSQKPTKHIFLHQIKVNTYLFKPTRVQVFSAHTFRCKAIPYLGLHGRVLLKTHGPHARINKTHSIKTHSDYSLKMCSSGFFHELWHNFFSGFLSEEARLCNCVSSVVYSCECLLHRHKLRDR